ncbi:MAG: DUF4388 domain-containing protein [Thermodesulfobacteriota bacterium]
MALKGSLADMAIIDLMQFPHTGRKTGHLIITGAEGEAKLFYENGSLVHAKLGEASGMEALVRVVDWSDGTFEFINDLEPEARSIELDLHRAVMQALKIHDELKAKEQQRAATFSDQGDMDRVLVGKLTEFIGANDFVLHASVLDSDGRVRAAADGAEGTPEGIEELRSMLHTLMGSYSRGTVSRMLIQDNLGTVVLVRLHDGGCVIAIASERASLGSVSMSVGKLAVGLI